MKQITTIILVILLAFFAVQCSPKHFPPSTTTVVNVVDSIAWHDSTVVSYITKERIVDVVNPLDTLKLETEYAKAEAYLDTTNRVLKGSLENKSDVPVKTVIKWKEKILYKDSLVTKEVPVPYEVTKEVKVIPKFFWICLIIIIGELVWVFWKAYKKGVLHWPF